MVAPLLYHSIWVYVGRQEVKDIQLYSTAHHITTQTKRRSRSACGVVAAGLTTMSGSSGRIGASHQYTLVARHYTLPANKRVANSAGKHRTRTPTAARCRAPSGVGLSTLCRTVPSRSAASGMTASRMGRGGSTYTRALIFRLRALQALVTGIW